MQKLFKIYSSELNRYKKEIKDPLFTWKYFFKWSTTLEKTKTSIDYGLPWFTFNAISVLNSFLKPGMKIFEFGGGGSTIFFLKKGCQVYTVEHNKDWFEALKASIAAKKYASSWKGFYITPNAGLLNPVPDHSDPDQYSSSDESFANVNFKDYATKVREYENGFFDVILVDGRSRPSCMKESFEKVKKGGLLILDNTERAYYLKNIDKELKKEFRILSDTYGPVPYIEWFNKTTIWVKL